MVISEREWYNHLDLDLIQETNPYIASRRTLLKSLPENEFDSLLGEKINQISISPQINNHNSIEYVFPRLENDNLLFGECFLDFDDDTYKAIPIESTLDTSGLVITKINNKNIYLALQEIFEMSGIPIHILKIGITQAKYHNIRVSIKFDNQDILMNNYPNLNCNIHQHNGICKPSDGGFLNQSIYQPRSSLHYITRSTKQVKFHGFLHCPLILVKSSQQPTSILFNNLVRLKLPRTLKYIGYYLISETKDTIFNSENIKNTINFSGMTDIVLEFEKPLENEIVEIVLLKWDVLVKASGMYGLRFQG